MTRKWMVARSVSFGQQIGFQLTVFYTIKMRQPCMFLLQAHECEFLEFQAWDWITENFEPVSESPEFLDLNSNSLVEIIKYDDIQVGYFNYFSLILISYLCAVLLNIYSNVTRLSQ